MELSDLLRHVAGVLDRMGLPYLVTGSIVTIFHGEPRFTNDIDVVVRLRPEQAREFCRAFPEGDFYVSEEAALRAIAHHSQFNIIHPASGLKIDVVVPADTPFDRSRFARAERVRPEPDFEATFATVEDVILKKMEYYREGGSEKHLRDIAGVLKISGDRLDRDYVAAWAGRLGIEEIWQAVVERAGG